MMDLHYCPNCLCFKKGFSRGQIRACIDRGQLECVRGHELGLIAFKR